VDRCGEGDRGRDLVCIKCVLVYPLLQALDGFLLVASSDGTIVYLSESIHHHLGIFQVRGGE
jgi:hypothetical protein